MRTAIERDALGEPRDGVFRGRIGRRVRSRRVCGERAVVDDASPARVLRLHQPDRLLGAQEGAGEVDRDHRTPLRVGHVLQRDAGSADAGVVEEHI